MRSIPQPRSGFAKDDRFFPLGFSAGAEAEELGIHVSTTQVRSSGAQLAELAPLLDAG
jgi:hypothetical protein